MADDEKEPLAHDEKSPAVDISIACAKGYFADPLIRTIREWVLNEKPCRHAEMVGRVVREQNLSSAVDAIREDFDRTILVTIGYENAEVSDNLDFPEASRLEVVVCRSGDDEIAPSRPSASPLDPLRVEAKGDPVRFIRKAVARLKFRRGATVSPLHGTVGELERYFALRYRVWKAMNYLQSSKCDYSATQLELNYTDRFSYPIGVLSTEDGSMLGCGRLVRGFGNENPKLLPILNQIVESRGDFCLKENFALPERAEHPFDLLESFPDFMNYYRELVVRRITKAELSRVIVDPSVQKSGLGEVIVDSLIAQAERMGIERLFLACIAKHAHFYELSGFQLIQGLTCESFAGVGVPAVAMDLSL